MSPQEACRWVAPDQPNPSPHQDDLELDPARQRWIEELPLTDEQRADAALVRRTIEGDITTYVGSAREQFDAPRRPSASQPSAGERRRAVMSRRGRELL
ncbi:hypothetical protein BC89_29680 [Pseudomonas monteilii]|nr:hypothetical protein BC89_29680 [Pseudomonas monteilii]